MTTPTVVLVHGAFTDARVWAPVTTNLMREGYAVRVPPVSNLSLSGDAAYIKSFVEQIDGPVVLAGHSYGGAVITVAGDADNVVALVYVAGHALVEGESIRDLHGKFPDSQVSANVIRSTYLGTARNTGIELSVAIETFPTIFAAGADEEMAAVLAVSQRPLASVAVGEPASVAAWRSKPSWGIVSGSDQIINPDVERFGYERAGVRATVEVDAPHLVTLTHPQEVSRVIIEAIAELRQDAALTDLVAAHHRLEVAR